MRHFVCININGDDCQCLLITVKDYRSISAFVCTCPCWNKTQTWYDLELQFPHLPCILSFFVVSLASQWNLMSVCWSAGLSFSCYNFLKGRWVTPPCSYQSVFLFLNVNIGFMHSRMSSFRFNMYICIFRAMRSFENGEFRIPGPFYSYRVKNTADPARILCYTVYIYI